METPDEVKQVEDHPRFPVKSVVGAVSAVASWLILQGFDLPAWLNLVLIFASTGGSTYAVRNPKRLKGAGR
jgi:hypothetical protein